ncbi:FHA domain-containing protein [Phormidium sp. LEGE 05292]|uniref:adenylate/guanylate cyclase domain-containing protein n=1 Tax=[Phormidium] sp. LEGE 05292 TaxID=767427 RepID=UPI00187F632F|nr:adenylate/guanylate cyclase domain-containing protein [Phormidium sp. LEGE 05292]MBE9228775.1 FHA domain-containing protein [Phormidium sp. LEGE 05292]
MPYLIKNPDSINQEIYELRPGENTIGREKDNTIIINDPSVSRHHAKITISENLVTIKDLKSRNCTFVNQMKTDFWQLKDQDIIWCGNVAFKFLTFFEVTAPIPNKDDDFKWSIVKTLSLEQTRVKMQDLLNQNSTEHSESVLMLRQQNADQRAVDKLKILLEVGKQLSSPEEPEILLEKILDLLFNIVRVDRAIILLINEESGRLEKKAAKFRSGVPEFDQFYSTKIAKFVCQTGDAILTSDACTDNRFDDSESILRQAIHASMCIPMKPRDKVIGVLYADNITMINIYSEEDLEFLTALVNQAAIALENSQLYKKMQAEAVVRTKLESFFPTAVIKKLKEEGNLEIIDTQVTALFCDISGFTQMSEKMSPRQVIEMLNEYFKVMVEDIVFQYEGTLEKYIGDALLAIWGAPYQQPDDADRAVRAAIAMQWAVESLNVEWEKQRNLQIQIHIGINTGKVAAGNIGSPRLIQYATIGDTTNVTSRICSAANPGEILISQTTFDKLSDRNLPLEKMTPVLVKGKEQPLELYRINWKQIAKSSS